MSEAMIKALSREGKILEYWRKRYLAQAAAVAAGAAGAVAAVLAFVNAFLVQAMFILGIALIAYMMFKELRESLQARGEGLILSKSALLFSGLAFDYGGSAAAVDSLNVPGIGEYGVRECRNVMAGQGFVLEEDWLYSVVSAKFLAVNHTAFEGVVLTADCHANAAAALNSPQVRQAAEKLKSLLGAEEMYCAAAGKTAGFYFKTGRKIFYQFRLFNTNTTGAFVRRVETLRAAVGEILAKLGNPGD